MQRGHDGDTHGADSDRPQFARTDTVELRGDCPRWIVDVLDAVVLARGGQSANIHRATVWNEIMAEWAEKKVHEATLIQKLSRGNPTGPERTVQDLQVVDGRRA